MAHAPLFHAGGHKRPNVPNGQAIRVHALAILRALENRFAEDLAYLCNLVFRHTCGFRPQIWCDVYEKVKRGAMAQTPCPGHSYSECRAYNSNNMCHHFQHGLAYRRGSVDGPVSFMNWSIIRARALMKGAYASVFSWA